MAQTVLDGVDALQKATGTHLGYSDWLEITQDRIDGFADATGDHQWIHVDPERAKDGPFGTTIAHGYLTLALTNLLLPQLLQVPGATMGINYGTDRVRFPAPVPVGSRIRMSSELVDVTDIRRRVAGRATREGRPGRGRSAELARPRRARAGVERQHRQLAPPRQLATEQRAQRGSLIHDGTEQRRVGGHVDGAEQADGPGEPV